MRQRGKMEFGGLPTSLSLRASAHTGVAISRIEVLFLDNTQVNFGKWNKKNGLYDDKLPEIRWRFPRQCAHWLGMTMLFESLAYLCKFQFVRLLNEAGTHSFLYTDFT